MGKDYIPDFWMPALDCCSVPGCMEVPNVICPGVDYGPPPPNIEEWREILWKNNECGMKCCQLHQMEGYCLSHYPHYKIFQEKKIREDKERQEREAAALKQKRYQEYLIMADHLRPRPWIFVVSGLFFGALFFIIGMTNKNLDGTASRITEIFALASVGSPVIFILIFYLAVQYSYKIANRMSRQWPEFDQFYRTWYKDKKLKDDSRLMDIIIAGMTVVAITGSKPIILIDLDRDRDE